jgi:hypothetical protein
MSDNELKDMLDAEIARLAAHVGAGIASLLEHGINQGQKRDPTLLGRIVEYAHLGGQMRAVIVCEPDLRITGEMVRDLGNGRLERFELFTHVIPGGPDAGAGLH